MKKAIKDIILSLISGILLAYSSVTMNSYLAWICFMPYLDNSNRGISEIVDDKGRVLVQKSI